MIMTPGATDNRRAAPLTAKSARRAVRRIVTSIIGAAVLVFAILLTPRLPALVGFHGERPEFDELVSALAADRERPVEGRMSAGFAYAPFRSPTRGERSASFAVAAAAARIEQRENRADDARAHAALGLAYLAGRNWDRAIETLDDATHQDPGNAAGFIDLSAAYLARAGSAGGAEDWARGLAAASRAIKLAPQRSEGYFNRAIALEKLHLTQRAVDAWTEYQRLDSGTGWAAESAARARALAALAQRPASELSVGSVDNQQLRERIEDVLLAEWGTATIEADAGTAAERLDQVERLAGELVAAGGDRMAYDEVRRIRQARGTARTLQALARGHALYAQARAAYLADKQREAARLMSRAAQDLRTAGSSYAAWEHIFNAIALRTEGSADLSLEALSKVGADGLPRSYTHLRSRHAWAYGVARDEQGRFDLGVQYLSQAADGFRDSGERGNLARTLAILAEAHWSLGDHAAAWMRVLEVLEDVERGNNASNNYHLAVAAKLSLSAGLPEAALEFDNVRVSAARTPRAKVESLQRRARTLVLLGDTRAAAADIERAAEAAAQLTDPALRERNEADVNIARAEVYVASDLEKAVEAADAALDYVRHGDPAFALGKLLALRGRSRQALGDSVGAEADLVAAIEAFEAKRRSLTSTEDRVRAFEYERPAFKLLIGFESAARSDAAAALRTAERSRAGGWAHAGRQRAAFLDPTVDYRMLHPDVAMVYFETLDDQVLVWVLTRDGYHHFSRPISLSALTRQIARVERSIQRGATLESLEPVSAELVRDLITPALAYAGSRPVVVFVPDGPLYSVPFAALPVDRQRPLLADLTIAVAPSFTSFVHMSSRLEGLAPDDVLAVGAGHDPRATGLSALPFANAEAKAIGDLYPRRTVLPGEAATVNRVLAADHTVVHFAGHTVVNREFPLFSRLFLAPDGGDAGVLLASQVLDHAFPRTRVVVLATCEAGAGIVIDGEGIVSVARAFLAAGVPAVVNSLWPVADDSSELFTTFHRELRQRRDAASALRAAQLAQFRRSGSSAPVRAWGGMAALGGIAISGK